MRFARVASFLVLLGLLARPGLAGRLDLDFYSEPADRTAQDNYFMPPETWLPGSPLSMRGESRTVRAIAHGGFAAMGVAGFVAGLAGSSLCGPPCVVGFGIVTLVQGFELWRTVRPAPL